jgi:hypothetical protein
MKHHVTGNTLDWITMDVNPGCGEYTRGLSFSAKCYQTCFPRRRAEAHAGYRPQMVVITPGIANPFSILAVAVVRDKGKSDRLARVAISAPGR